MGSGDTRTHVRGHRDMGARGDMGTQGGVGDREMGT